MAKRKTKAKVAEPKEPTESRSEALPEIQEDGMNIKAERENLYKSWKRLVKIANTLLDQAEINPLSVKASMLAQIVRVLSQSGKILDDYEKHLRKVEEEPEIDPETGDEVMTPEQEQMIKDYEELAKGYNNSDEYKDPDLGYGMNFRRD